MAENPARPVTRSLIAENIGIATISKELSQNNVAKNWGFCILLL